jgi:hypothetical protein
VVSLRVLIAAAIASSAGLTASIAAPPSPTAGLGVAVFGPLLAVALALAARVLLALERAHPRRRLAPAQTMSEFRIQRRLRREAR